MLKVSSREAGRLEHVGEVCLAAGSRTVSAKEKKSNKWILAQEARRFESRDRSKGDSLRQSRHGRPVAALCQTLRLPSRPFVGHCVQKSQRKECQAQGLDQSDQRRANRRTFHAPRADELPNEVDTILRQTHTDRMVPVLAQVASHHDLLLVVLFLAEAVELVVLVLVAVDGLVLVRGRLDRL